MTQKCEEWKKVWRAQQLVINEDQGQRVANRALYIARCAEHLFCAPLTIVLSVTDESSPCRRRMSSVVHTPPPLSNRGLLLRLRIRNGTGNEDNEWEL
ncbi:hypothetical protein TNCT_104181 [Trichonephila clavata]|uniref:Uncharacterized protein n=1 Tax=Trichonephila clavata TaxID=2740835 RepID=A0A8X6KES2_TRICU|nr:hypothetical protein TNCT_104181 [Trichonephila clavata]